MEKTDTFVRARIDKATKERAASALQSMGLTLSDAIRMLLIKVAEERRLPFDIKAPTIRHKSGESNDN